MPLFYELIQVSLGNRNLLSTTPSNQEWSVLYKESERQAIIGVILSGLDNLPDYQRPPKELLLQWIGIGEMIRHQNHLVNLRCLEIANKFKDDGYSCCVLKGLGNAMMYPNPYSRSAGDIDIWVEGGKKRMVEYIHSVFPSINVQYHHMSFPIFDDVEVEVHYYPSYCYNKIHNRRLQEYFRNRENEQFRNYVSFLGTDEKICVPTPSFNLVFQLSHMMRHFFTQGIGLRHAIDYYYLLCKEISSNDKQDALKVIRQCGMFKFLCSIMWIEREILGLQKNLDFAPVNAKAGKLVLAEMMKGGNFGKGYDNNKGSALTVFTKQMVYRLRYVKEFPSEPLWRPIALVWDYVKKRI